jgi:hypothetical protein
MAEEKFDLAGTILDFLKNYGPATEQEIYAYLNGEMETLGKGNPKLDGLIELEQDAKGVYWHRKVAFLLDGNLLNGTLDLTDGDPPRWKLPGAAE